MHNQHLEPVLYWQIILLSLLTCSIANANTNKSQVANKYQIVDEMFTSDFQTKTTDIVKIESYRSATVKEAQVVKNIETIRDKFKQWVDDFNAEQNTLKLQFFEWKQKVNGKSGKRSKPTSFSRCILSPPC